VPSGNNLLPRSHAAFKQMPQILRRLYPFLPGGCYNERKDNQMGKFWSSQTTPHAKNENQTKPGWAMASGKQEMVSPLGFEISEKEG